MTKTTKKLIGFCSVDSGTIMICDPCYAIPSKKVMVSPKEMLKWSKDHKGYDEIFDEMHKNDPQCFVQTSNPVIAYIAGDAIISHTHDGDGTYPVYAEIDKNSRVKSLTIKFV